LRSHFLEHVLSVEAAECALGQLLVGQERPWLLRTSNGDVIAYFHVDMELDGVENRHVCADMSGRHHGEDEAVIDFLKKIQDKAGGVLDANSN